MKIKFETIAPGILIAATGVGAGDLMTASLGGSAIGVALLWAAVVGGLLKWFLNEGIARWQMATETTLLEGWITHLGGWIKWVFIIYLAAWTFFTGGALVTACGVAGSGLLPLSSNPDLSKIIWGIAHALMGYTLVRLGGYKLFEKVMSFCIGLMFLTVIITAVQLLPSGKVLAGGLVPSLPGGGIGWILGILGGVGGTVTLLAYGYWIREKHRSGYEGLKLSRLDLGIGYTMTAIFGMAMIIIGSNVQITGSGSRVALILAEQLESLMGPFGKWLFLIGFWGAVFSSLLGVWQSIPYLFTDFMRLWKKLEIKPKEFTQSQPYRWYLLAMTFVPIPILWMSVKKAQIIYAIFGSLFMPLLALTLLILNNKSTLIGKQFKNRWLVNTVLMIVLLFFTFLGLRQIIFKILLLF